MNKKNGLSRYQREKLISAFCADVTASQAAVLLRLNRNTVNRYFTLFRRAIYAHQVALCAQLEGCVEVDESYFARTRPRGSNRPKKRGRGTNQQPVFGILERGGRVYTEVVSDVKKKTLQDVIKGKVDLSSVVVSDGWRAYDGLVDVGFDKHLRISKRQHGPVHNGVHINGIESFWSFTKRRLAKFNGVRKNFDIHLKECEWRWGKNQGTLVAELKQMLV